MDTEKGKVFCPKTGKEIFSGRHCERARRPTWGDSSRCCDHFGYWENERVWVCRYSKERELRLNGENGREVLE